MKKVFSENDYHFFFKIGVWLKAIITVGELVAGTLLAFFSYANLYKIISFLADDGLTENPRNFIWDYVARSFQNFTATPQAIWVFIFLSHGLVKIFLVGGLLRDRLWSYPASAIIFMLFVFYQIYQYAFTPSIFLIIVSAFDLVLIGLILHEYSHKRRHLKTF